MENLLDINYELFAMQRYNIHSKSFPALGRGPASGLRVFSVGNGVHFECHSIESTLLYGEHYSTHNGIIDVILRIEEVISGELEVYEMGGEPGDQYICIRKLETELIDLNNPVPDEFKYVSTQSILELMKARKNFIEKKEDMLFIEKQKVIHD